MYLEGDQSLWIGCVRCSKPWRTTVGLDIAAARLLTSSSTYPCCPTTHILRSKQWDIPANINVFKLVYLRYWIINIIYAVFSKILIIYTGLVIRREESGHFIVYVYVFFLETIVDVLFNHLNSVSRDSIK
jgi:hypothetical protein